MDSRMISVNHSCGLLGVDSVAAHRRLTDCSVCVRACVCVRHNLELF